MAEETQLVKKRLRIHEDGYQTLTKEEEEDGETTTTTNTTTFKRQKSYDDHVISLLMEEEEEGSDATASPAPGGDDHEVRDDSVLRRLLEASDDELGLLPTYKSDQDTTAHHIDDDLELYSSVDIIVEGSVATEVEEGSSIDVGVGGHLWEIEDEAANYYALMQAQLFM